LVKHADQFPPDFARHRWSIYDAIAPALLLLAPFVLFLKHNSYPYLTPETLLSYAGFAVVGGCLGFAAAVGGRITRSLLIAFLVTLFVDVQFDLLPWWGKRVAVAFTVPFVLTWFLGNHASRILSAVFATIIVSSLLLPAGDDAPKAPAAADASASDQPVLVHLVLDEHIGIEGIPPELERAREVKEKLVAFYVSNGFRLFGRAYSEYFDSYNSLSHVMNFSPGSYDVDLVAKSDGSYRWRMKRNEYLRRVRERGFRMHVSQTTYMSFCEDGQVTVDECEVGNYTTLESFSRAPLSVFQKIRVILSLYVERSFFYGVLKKVNRQLHDFAQDHGISVPLVAWERDGRGTFLAMEQLEHLRRQLATAAPGNAYFAHVLLPHNPYVYRSDCKLREPDGWLRRTSKSAPTGMSNTPETRLKRYEYYLEQVECVTSRLGGIFDAMREVGTYRDALIIIYGDHGSRINLIDPSIDVVDRMVDSDFLDAFSTLFAIKAPGIEPGYDLSTRSIQELVANWVAADFNALPNPVDDEGPARVYLNGQGNSWVRHPLRGFDVAEP